MAIDEPLLPPHVTLLGKALRPLPAQIDTALRTPTPPEEPETSFVTAAQIGLAKLDRGVERMVSEVNALGRIVTASDAPDADVHRAAGRVEAVLDDQLRLHAALYHLRAEPAYVRGQELLLATYRNTLIQIRDWLQEIVETLADPMAALEKRGLPTSGKVELQLSLELTAPKELGQFRDWLAREADEEDERTSRADAWGTLLTLAAGVLLGGLFFGDDE